MGAGEQDVFMTEALAIRCWSLRLASPVTVRSSSPGRLGSLLLDVNNTYHYCG